MRRICLYWLLGMNLVWASCEERNQLLPDTRIMLDAEVQDMVQQHSRAVSEENSVDIRTGVLVTGMKAAVWFSESAGVYPESNPTAPTNLPYRAELTYEEGSTIVYTDYSNPDNPQNPVSYEVVEQGQPEKRVYCIGLYPHTGWTSSTQTDGKTIATHAVNGKQDLMFAAEESGSLTDKMEKQNYRHLLAWFRFTVRATEPEAVNDWGQLTSIRLVKAQGSLDILLGEGTVTYSTPSEDVEVLNQSQELTVAIKDVGSTLCMPAASYDLQLTTTKGEMKTLTVTTSGGFKAGELYLVNLYFNEYNDINAVCSLVPWNEENVEL